MSPSRSSPSSRYERELEVALAAARDAAATFREEFHRTGGPRGAEGKAPADTETERRIRARLAAAFPSYGLRAEEEPELDEGPKGEEPHVWLVDPNDGTGAWLSGFRGACVSIALLRGDVPVLGVVLAFNAPDDDGEEFTWAEGRDVERNGVACPKLPTRTELESSDIVFSSQSADELSELNAELVAPARFIAVPSIAYRLALVASGEGVVATSLNQPRDLDYAAGHALLLGVGGDLFDREGDPVRYSTEHPTSIRDAFGGAPALCRALCGRPFRRIFERSPPERRPFDLAWPERGATIRDAGVLDRARGCLYGQFAGDSLGSLVEFRGAASIAGDYPEGVHWLADGGTFNTLAGQPTDDSEMALALARALLAEGRYDAEAAVSAYALWYESGPFDIGNTTATALRPATRAPAGRQAAAARAAGSRRSQANGALMRLSPLAIFGHAAAQAQLVAWARRDAELTHPHRICGDANAVFAATLAFAIASGPSAEEAHTHACAVATAIDADALVHAALEEALAGPPVDFMHQMGWLRIALHNAFFQLLTAPTLAAGVSDTVGRGGDTDTNGAIAGALLGAVHGGRAVPAQWRRAIRSCRPIRGLPGALNPRPRWLWPVDVETLAERLLTAGLRAPL